MEIMIAGCAGFIFLHLGISGTLLRGVAINALGYYPYLGVFSTLTFVTLGIMIWGYAIVPHTDFLWQPSATAYKITKVLLLISLVSLAMGTLSSNPTNMLNEKAIDKEIVKMMKITRHPIQWAILLFAIGHLIANGDTASIILFGTLALVSSIGMLLVDRRKRKEEDPRWKEFMEKTSLVPFASIISGRLKFTAADINWKGLIAGCGLYVAVYWLHDMVAGGASLF